MGVMSVRAVCGAAMAGVLAVTTLPVRAADYPTKPIRWIVPFPAGATDIQARAVAEKVQPRIGQPIIIETKPGASTAIGTEYVANAAPDGYTMLFTASVLVTLKPLVKELKFDPDKAFAPVSLVAQGFFVAGVNPSLPVKSMAELIAYSKANPGKLNYVSLGRNSVMLMVEQLKLQTGLDLTPIPYQGMAPGRIALIRNDVQFIIDGPQGLKPLADAGQIRLLMTAGPSRLATLPDVPNASEAGVPGYVAGYLLALLAPAGTARDIINRTSSEIAAAVNTPELKKLFIDSGGESVGSTPEALAQRLANDARKFAEAARAAKLQPE